MVTAIIGIVALLLLAVSAVLVPSRGQLVIPTAVTGLVVLAGAGTMAVLGQRHWDGCGTASTATAQRPAGVSQAELDALVKAQGGAQPAGEACPTSPLGLRDPW